MTRTCINTGGLPVTDDLSEWIKMVPSPISPRDLKFRLALRSPSGEVVEGFSAVIKKPTANPSFKNRDSQSTP